MFRAKIFLMTSDTGNDSVVLVSEAVATYQEADAILFRMIGTGQTLGGDIETRVPGIGWVVEQGTSNAEFEGRDRYLDGLEAMAV